MIRNRITCQILIAVLLLLFPFIVIQKSRTPTIESIALIASNCDQGMVELSSSYQTTVSLYNSSQNTIEVQGIYTSCSCTSVTPTRFTLESGSTADLAVVIDLTRLIPDVLNEGGAEFDVSVYLDTDRYHRHGFSIYGTIRVPITLEQRDYNLGAFSESSTLNVKLTADTVGKSRIRFERLPSYVQIDTSSSTRDETVASLTVSPPFLGDFYLKPEVVVDDERGSRSVPLSIQGRRTGGFSVTPESLRFGIVAMGHSATVTALLASTKQLDTGQLSIYSPEQIHVDHEPTSNGILLRISLVETKTSGSLRGLISLCVSNDNGEDQTLLIPWSASVIDTQTDIQ